MIQHKRRVDYIWKRYKQISLGEKAQSEIEEFYKEKVIVDSPSIDITKNKCDKLVHGFLKKVGKDGIALTVPDTEGSLATGVKTGKADECDYSVEMCLSELDDISLSDDPFEFVFEDDIDSDCIKTSGVFAADGKRMFPDDKRRKRIRKRSPEPIRDGFTAVRLGDSDAENFSAFCLKHKNEHNWLIPILLLATFYKSLKDCIDKYQTYKRDKVKIHLNSTMKGPAVTFTIMEEGESDTSVDITLKISLPPSVLSLEDFTWPRRQTKRWLDESVIEKVLQQQIYLVPKGDKYWKISFANCENALLEDIDTKDTWRKGCLRLMKRKLLQWRSKSKTGLKGISSYLLKVSLLWLCEYMPEDDLWTKDQLANRYMTFLKEFSYRLKIVYIGEYFNPGVNLLKGKKTEEIEEVRELIDSEISSLRTTSSSVSQLEE